MAFIGSGPMSPEQGAMWMAYKYPGMFASQLEEPVDPAIPTFADFDAYATYRTREAARELPDNLGALGAWWARNKILQPFNDLAAYKGVPMHARFANEGLKFGENLDAGIRGPFQGSRSLGRTMRAGTSFTSSVGMGPMSRTPGMLKGSALASEVRAGTRVSRGVQSSSLFDLAKVAVPTSALAGARSFLFWNFAVGNGKQFFEENRTDADLIFQVSKHVAWGAVNKEITNRFLRPGLQQLEKRFITTGARSEQLRMMGLLDDAGRVTPGAERKVEELAARSMKGRTLGDRVEMLRASRTVAAREAASQTKTTLLGGLRKAAGAVTMGEFGAGTRTFFETAKAVTGKAAGIGLSALNVANAFSGVFAVKNIIDAFNSYQHDMRKELLKGAFTRDLVFQQQVPISPGGTENSRAIQAIQNSGLNARSYMGNEAAMMR